MRSQSPNRDAGKPRSGKGKGRGSKASSRSHSPSPGSAGRTGVEAEGEKPFFSDRVQNAPHPRRPGTGKGRKGQWRRENEAAPTPLPESVSGASGKGTRGGLGGKVMEASLNEQVWKSLSSTAQRSLALLGRTTPWPCFQRVLIPWPGNFWETFPVLGSENDYWHMRQRAAEQDMELIIRGRRNQRPTLTLLGADRAAMGAFMRDLINACSSKDAEGYHQMQKVRRLAD